MVGRRTDAHAIGAERCARLRHCEPYRRHLCKPRDEEGLEALADREEGALLLGNIEQAYAKWPKHLPDCEAYTRRDFVGVMLSPGWEWAGIADADSLTKEELTLRRMERLATIAPQRYCPDGFIFIWVSKEDILAVTEYCYKHRFVYVENLTWVQLSPNNSISQRSSPCIRRGHHTLYIFRKASEKTKEIELKHQRSPDVVFDFMRVDERGNLRPPKAVYDSIETLLPQGKGKLLELYTPLDDDGIAPAARDGWVCVAQE